ncbi:MAG: DMT family transporter [Rhodospirillaceae bacterium]|nr:DMT family transporter [Rhodospirillaceae bacterium]
MSAPAGAGTRNIPLATLWALGAAFGWTSMAVVVRYLEGRVPSWDVSFYRALTALLIGAAPMYLMKGRRLSALLPRRELTGAYLVRGVIMFLAQAAYYFALMHMPLADASVLNATAPIFSAVMAIFLLHERVGADRWFFIMVGFAGVLVIIQPGFHSVPVEALLALLSAALFALSSILNKRLVTIESGTSIVYGTNFYIAIAGLGVVLIWGTIPRPTDLLIVALIGIAGAAAQYCISRALAHAEVSYISPFEFLRVPLIAFAAWMLFGQVPPLIFGLGALLVFAGVFMLARSAVRRRPPATAESAA